jgi:type II secretory pathway pseudopilin PulG
LYCAYAILIELLIVIVILGVLAAAIIPNLSKFVGQGNVGAANAELATVKTAIAAYLSEDHGAISAGSYPTASGDTDDDLVPGSINPYISGTAVTTVYHIAANGDIDDANSPNVWTAKGLSFTGGKWVK